MCGGLSWDLRFLKTFRSNFTKKWVLCAKNEEDRKKKGTQEKGKDVWEEKKS